MATKKRDDKSFTQALRDTLNSYREINADDWRSFSTRLGIPESLTSLYRSGARYPSMSGLLEIEQVFPGFMRSLVDRYYAIERERKNLERRDDDEYGNFALQQVGGPV